MPSLRTEELEYEEECEESEAKDENDERSESDSSKSVRVDRGDEVASEDDRVDSEFDQGPKEEGRGGVNKERVRSGEEEMGEELLIERSS